jgi:peroxiredoxin
MPAIQQLYNRHKAQGFIVVGLSVDAEGASVVKPFAKEHGLTFPIGLDPKMTIAEKFSVRALPSTFLIDKEGKILAMALGPREWNNSNAHALIRSLIVSP